MRAIDADRLLKMMSHWKPYMDMDKVRKAVKNMPTLTPPNEWVSVEERLPEDEARQYIKDELDGIGYLYPCLLTYKSPNTERIHVVRFYYDIIQKWFVNNGEELCEKGRCIAWMPLPAPPGKDNNVPTKAQNEPLTIEELRAELEQVKAERDAAVSWAQKYTESIDMPCVACKHNTGDYVCTAICGNCGPMGAESCKWEFDFSGELKED